MPILDEEGLKLRAARMEQSVITAHAHLARIKRIRQEFEASGAANVVTVQLTPDPTANPLKPSTLHKALRPFVELGKKCDTEQT
jgi:hypothetical protein